MEIKGKYDVWFYILCIALFVFPILFLGTGKGSVGIVFIPYYLIITPLIVPMLVRNKVVLQEESFIFYFGFSKKEYMYKDIKAMYKSRDLTASSACSLDRIYIDTKENDMLISLEDNDAFIKEVKKHNPNIKEK